MEVNRVFRQALAARSAASPRCPRIVPTTRLVLRIGSVALTFSPRSSAGARKVKQHLVVQRVLQPMVLRNLAIAANIRTDFGLVKDCRVIQALAPSNARRPCALRACPPRPTISLTVRKPSLAMYSRISWAMKRMKLTTCSGSPVNLLAQLGILRRDAHRAGIEMAHAHHDATQRHQRRWSQNRTLRPQAARRSPRRGRS